MYCLWLGVHKIYNLKQLKRHFDFDAVEMYLLGGGLSRWLRQCNESEIADRVEKIDLLGDISKQLSDIFSVKLPKGRRNMPLPSEAPKSPAAAGTEFTAFSSAPLGLKEANAASFPSPTNSFSASAGSYTPEAASETSSFKFGEGSFALSSFNVGSFETMSFSLGLSSFLYGSFASGSFNYHEYEYEYAFRSSFGFGSFALGSFNSGSFDSGSFGVNYNSAAHTKTYGLAVGRTEENKENACGVRIAALPTEEKIRLNFSACPLNRFGYGIHLI